MSKSHEDSSKINKTNIFSEDNSKLEWMYKSGSELLNREEYLLGKAIDKQFEQLDDEEKKHRVLSGVTVPKNHVEHECVPFSIRNYRAFHNDEQVDIQRKILEDPLMSIRQKEMESRRRILENPVKLKELHRLLKKEAEVNKSKDMKKKKKKKDKNRKKKKKSKDKHASSSSSSSDDEDLDKLLAKKYRQIKEQFGGGGAINLKDIFRKEVGNSPEDDKKHNRKRNASQSCDSDSSPSPEKRLKHSHKFPERGRRNQVENGRRSNYPQKMNVRRSSSGGSSPRHDRDYASKRNIYPNSRVGKQSESLDRERRKDYSSGSRTKEPKRNSSREKRRDSSSGSSSEAKSDNEKPYKRNYGLVTAAGEKIQLKGSSSKSSEISKSSRESAEQLALAQQSRKNSYKPRLTAEEKERRYQEMMENAEWREKERKTKVDKYRKEYERETNEVRNFDKNFINKEMHKAMTNQTSVESRLKSNINNIQRSGRAMDSNFAKR